MSEAIIDGINEFTYLFNDNQQGISIKFHTASVKNCKLYFTENSLKKGNIVEISTLGEGEVDVTCFNENGDYFTLSPNQPTSAKLEFVQIKPTALIKVTFNLHNIRKKIWLQEEITINLNESETEKLFIVPKS